MINRTGTSIATHGYKCGAGSSLVSIATFGYVCFGQAFVEAIGSVWRAVGSGTTWDADPASALWQAACAALIWNADDNC